MCSLHMGDTATKKGPRAVWHRDPVVPLFASGLDDSCIIAPPQSRCKHFLRPAAIFVSSARFCRRPAPPFLCRNTTAQDKTKLRISGLFLYFISIFLRICLILLIQAPDARTFSAGRSAGSLFIRLHFAARLAFCQKRCRMKKTKPGRQPVQEKASSALFSFAAARDPALCNP